MVLDRDEWEKLKRELTANGGGIYDHEPFTIVVNYANNDMGRGHGHAEKLQDHQAERRRRFAGGRQRQPRVLRVHHPFPHPLERACPPSGTSRPKSRPVGKLSAGNAPLTARFVFVAYG